MESHSVTLTYTTWSLNVVNGGSQVPIAPATPRAVLVVEPGARRRLGHVGAARPHQGRPRAHALVSASVSGQWRAVSVVSRARSCAASVSFQFSFVSVRFSAANVPVDPARWTHLLPRTRWPGSRHRLRRDLHRRRPHPQDPQLARAAGRSPECPRPYPSRWLVPQVNQRGQGRPPSPGHRAPPVRACLLVCHFQVRG